MNTFAKAATNAINEAPARTANGMKARATTASKVLDLFSKVGGARGSILTREFNAAMSEDRDLTIRALLWTRDIREGAGERKQFRGLLTELEKSNPELAGKIMHKVPELGRWDDLFAYQDPINRKKALRMYADALMNGDGLAAKWAPREKSTKKELARELRVFMQMSPREYRKMLSGLTDVVEQKMCAKEWNKINFSHVPSLASARYQKAFGRNAGEAYSAYLRELQKPQEKRDPKVKINAGAVYPYDVVKSVWYGNVGVANEQWKALPNYVGNSNVIPLVDTSGSMTIQVASNMTAMDVAISLGLYVSEKNTGDFKDLFLNFSSNAKMQKLTGTLSERMAQMKNGYIGSTNLHSAFDEILRIAVRGNVPQDEMPDTLLIFSDMQFNSCCRYDDSAQEMIRRKYAKAGYAVPRIVYWNLSPYYGRENAPVRFDEKGTAYVSGFSPSLAKAVLANDLEDYTPYNVMLKTLMVDRYTY